MWPIGKIPVLRDEAKNRHDPRDQHHHRVSGAALSGQAQLFPARSATCARQMRLRDRFYDLYVHVPMQKIVADRLRPADKNDPFGVDEATTLLKTSLGMIEQDMAANRWAIGDDFTMADCAAAPASVLCQHGAAVSRHAQEVAAYLDRLMERPSYARVLKEAEPYFSMVPK